MKKISIRRVESAVQIDYNEIIIDNTNLSASTRNMWRGVADRLGLEYVEHEMNVSIDECIRRDAAREGSAQVGRAVIERMALFAGKIKFDLTRPIVIVDIDGTLANGSHRVHHVTVTEDHPKKDWLSYYEKVSDDTLIQPIRDLLTVLCDEYEICVVSGRPIRFNSGVEVGKHTVAWLEKHYVPYDHIFMRQSGDSRQDVIVKQEILDKLPKDRIAYVFDDRDSVVAMWRRNGLTCLQVAEGAF